MRKQVEEKVARVFGLRHLGHGKHELFDEAGNLKTSFKLHAYWVAEVSIFETLNSVITTVQRNDEYEGVILSVLRTSIGQKGLMLIPPIFEPQDREFGGKMPFKTLDLDDWDDPVASALKQLDAFPDKEFIRWGTTFYQYQFKVRVGNVCSIEMFISGPSFNEGLDKLSFSLLQTIHHFAELYEDDEINKFVGLT